MFNQEEYIIHYNSESPLVNHLPDLTDSFNEFIVQNLHNENSFMHIPVDETTQDVSTKYEPIDYSPSSPRGPPERTVFEGIYDFQVEINAADTHRKKFLYAPELNRIYVGMRADFPITFTWKGIPPRPLYVRATAVFADQAQAEKRVERCTQHTHDGSNAGMPEYIIKNVLHSSSSLGTSGVYYCGQPQYPDSWYSVLVKVSDNGKSNHAYQFVCKNSCSGGINRRAIDIVFTFEDLMGEVLGRQIVGARVCACPRRDLVRDRDADAAARGKRRANRNANRPDATLQNTNNSKKIKLEVAETIAQDQTLHTLPPLQIVGTQTMLAGFEVMLRMTEQAASFCKNDAQATEKYNKCIADLRAKIDELKKK